MGDSKIIQGMINPPGGRQVIQMLVELDLELHVCTLESSVW